MKIKVGVIFGGETVEHEVSIISAVQAMKHLNREKYEVVPIYISKNRDWYTGTMLEDIDIYRDFENLKKYAKRVVLVQKEGAFYLQSLKGFKKNIAELDIAFPIVHGNNAEDGTLQGYLDTVGIPYVGSHVLGSALGQDKVVMKQVFEQTGLPVVPYVWFYDNEYLSNMGAIEKDIHKIGYPVIVKPASLGSSVGITFVKEEEQLDAAINEAIRYDHKIIVEKAIENLVEVNCSVLGNYEHQETSAIEEVMSTREFLTYADKYIGGGKGKFKGAPVKSASKGMSGASRVIPARISDKLSTEIHEISKQAFRVLDLSGVCRIDFLIDSKKSCVYINEPNTIPGSLSFYLWEPVGKHYESLLEDMITLSIKDYKKKKKKTYSFETNILSNFQGTKGLKGIKK